MRIGAGIKAKRINTYKSSCRWAATAVQGLCDVALRPNKDIPTYFRCCLRPVLLYPVLLPIRWWCLCCWQHKSATNKQQPQGCWALTAMTKGNNKGPAHCTLDPLNPAHCVSLIMTPHHVLYTGTNTCGNCLGPRFSSISDGGRRNSWDLK